MEWNLLTWAQLLFFGLGAWYFWRSSRRKGAGEGLRCEDNIVEMDKLMAEAGTIQDLLTMHDFYMIDAKVEEVAVAL